MPTTDINKINWPDGNTTVLHDSRCDGVAEAVETILDGSDATLITKSISANGTYSASDDSADGYSQVSVDVPTGGGSGESRKAVNFIDYDGTIVHSYTAAEFAELTEFPENPSHDGLTAHGWNWTLSDAKTYAASYGRLDVGQMYLTSDGKTRLFIKLDEYRRAPVLGLGVDGSVDIDWGDGSAHTTLTGTNALTYVSTQPHTYQSGGEYVITLTVTGTATFLGKNSVCGLLMKDGFDANESRHYRNAIKRLFIGDSVTTIQSGAFSYCYSLGSVTIPDSVTTIGSNAFYNCYSLDNVTIPNSVTAIQSSTFYYCYSLDSVIIPYSVTLIQSQAFINCSSLKSITIPNSVTTIQSGAFSYCYSLGSVTIPDSVTTIGSNAFYNCYSLDNVTISNSVTTIESTVFNSCYSLGNVVIPDGVTKIQSQAFATDSSLGSVKFKRATPPTVQYANVFSGIPTDCTILVKSYAYLSASNYPSPSTYTYAYYDTIADGTTLPATIPDESTTSLTWYANIADLRAETNPITVGNGKEVYAKMTSTA